MKMLTLISFVSSLTVLVLSSKIYKDLQSQLEQADKLVKELTEEVNQKNQPEQENPTA